MTSPVRPVSRRSTAVGVLVLGFALFAFADTVADPDLWGHVRFGRDIVEAWQIPESDPYSYLTGGVAWINHEWLAEVAFALAYDHAGPAGLIALKTAIGLVILGGAYAHLLGVGMRPARAVLIVLAVSVPLRMGLGTIRPQMFTYLLYFGVLMLVSHARARPSRLWLAAPLVALWINLHGGVLAGVGVLGLWVLAEGGFRAARREGSPARRSAKVLAIVLPAVAAVAALGINPYGWQLPAFLLRTATVPRPEITEWAPLALASLPGVAYVGLLAIAVAGLAWSRRPRGPGEVLVLGVSMLLPMAAQRHFPLFALTVVVLAGEHIADAWDRVRPGRVGAGAGWRSAPAALCASGAILLAAGALPRFGCIRLDPSHWDYPAQAVALIRSSGVRGGLVLPFNWGEYAIWHLGPRVQVAMDGRRETVYPDEIYREYLDFIDGRGLWDALIGRPGTDMILVRVGSPPGNLLRLDPRWFRVYEDAVAVLFVRAGSPLAGPLGTTPPPPRPVDGRGLCFP